MGLDLGSISSSVLDFRSNPFFEAEMIAPSGIAFPWPYS
jgi:hypothetical protein